MAQKYIENECKSGLEVDLKWAGSGPEVDFKYLVVKMLLLYTLMLKMGQI